MKKNRFHLSSIFSWIFAFVLWLTLLPLLHAQQADKAFVVVIDPGHGGKDSGTKGTGRTKIYEKDVVLQIGKKVRDLLKKKDPDIKVIMTRSTDRFIGLRQRAEIANKNKADLFVSLHCNANPNKNVRGSETYVLGIHRNKDNLEVAKKENAVIKLEDDYKVKYKGFDPDAPETFIGLELMQEEFLEQSILLASLIQKEYQKRVHTKNRSVQQAGFAVLRLTYMPSVLTEVGFLSNPKEEKFLQSDEGQQKIAQSIAEAIVKYKKLILDNTSLGNPDESLREDKPVEIASTEEDNGHGGTTDASPAKPARTAPVHSSKPASHTSVTSSSSSGNAPSSVNCADCYFSVQIAMSTRKIPSGSSYFKGLTPVFYKKVGRAYKYYYGREKNFARAKKKLAEARRKGFKDAFLVGFKNGQRVPVKEILKK